MNWYKKIILAGNRKIFTTREFLDKLRYYGVIVERRGKGPRYILLNTTNNKRTNFHSHNEGEDVDHDVARGVLRSLEVDYWEFMVGKPTVKNLEPDTIETVEQKELDWKNSLWYRKQQEQLQAI